MKKKNKPYYLKMYREWMRKEEGLPRNGLCNSIGYNDHFLSLFYPTGDKFDTDLYFFGYNGSRKIREKGITFFELARTITPIRQTILLFMAAMNNEL